MYKNGCCSCPGLGAFCERLFTSSKTEVEKPANTTKLQTQIPPSSSVSEPEGEIYTALWPFQARADEELSFQEGEQFRICKREGDWWTAVKLDRNGSVTATGVVPQNFLARRQTVKEQPWYFGTLNRFETQNLLMAPENGVGAFLLRHSEKDHIGCVLSVVNSDREVKHIKVHQNQNGSFYLEQSQMFQSLENLVEHYRRNSLRSGTRLTRPCTRPVPKPQDLSHQTVDDWELPKEEFTLEEELGKGYFADVYRGKWKGMVNVAIKILKSNESLSHREFLMETQILKKLRHRHLITLFAVCTSSTPFYIITELMEKGNLLNFLRGEEGQELEAPALTEMASQVADGMTYLEEQNSIHRDLAARNVLVGPNCICKVADFGLARIIKEPIYSSVDQKIPYKWCAPEAISHGRFSNKSDVWSFGVLLYEMFTYGGIPYPAFSNQEVYNLISSGYRMPVPNKCPSHIYNIMLMCWRDSADERPDFSELTKFLENLLESNTESSYGTSDPAGGIS
ncbi:protein-tyrosine kinase 6 isoform X1 [Megalobrama amblycephala]|uniref:protein-tyrosine kinase 6 isoform X1 n=2 Tax=Megalobrama amblycephala TaxID=75352 RepID=UPI0020142741|nr:protein-tyrosine kinase 6 isoform X1 [Megalobrama amblycephala]